MKYELQKSNLFPKIYEVFQDIIHVSSRREKVSCHICVQEYLGCVDMLFYSNMLSTAVYKKPELQNNLFDIIKAHLFNMAKCIKVLHDINICHLDISLENFMIKDNNIKLIDFGLAKVVSPSNHLVNNNYGKQFYFSPEMMSGGQYDGMKRDIWSYGVCVYALYAHRMIAQNQDELLLALRYISQSFKTYLYSFNPSFIENDKDLIDLLSNCLKTDPESRYSIDQIINHKFFTKVDQTFQTEKSNLYDELYPQSCFPSASSNPNFIDIPELNNLDIPQVAEYDDDKSTTDSPDMENQMFLKKSSMRRRSMIMRLMESKGWKNFNSEKK